MTSIGFAGLGAMGFGMACNLSSKQQYHVIGYDIFAPSAQRFADQGGLIGESPRAVAQTSDFLICMAANSQQIDQILFSEETGALKGMCLCTDKSVLLSEIMAIRDRRLTRAQHYQHQQLFSYVQQSVRHSTRHCRRESLRPAGRM